jgi:hypothetical protein
MVYAAILSGLALKLRITAHSASALLCGAPHKAEFERSLIRERTHAGLPPRGVLVAPDAVRRN